MSKLTSSKERFADLYEKQKKSNIIAKAKQSRLDLLNKKINDAIAVVKEFEIDKLKENPYQPRIEIKPEEIKELANSIKEKGLLQPIIVTQDNNGDYFIVAGHRRVEAHKWLGKNKIKAIMIETSPALLAEYAIIENLQREDLDLIETAMALKKYKEEFNRTLEEIGKEIGKTKGYISQILNILNLPEEIVKDIKDNKSTKDILALNMLNSYAKKKFNMLNKLSIPQEIGANRELEKGKNEILELYQGFLKYGREWLKEEINKRLKSLNRQKAPGIKMEIGKRKTKLEINIPLTQEAVDKLKSLIEEFAEEFKIDNIKIKENKYLKQQKNSKNNKLKINY